ncbi:MAG: hypothetical protein V1742_06185 [Pseudomonadota bacterium]
MMSENMKVGPEDLKALSVDDSLEMVVDKFPLKYVLQALIRRHGLEQVKKALTELGDRK